MTSLEDWIKQQEIVITGSTEGRKLRVVEEHVIWRTVRHLLDYLEDLHAESKKIPATKYLEAPRNTLYNEGWDECFDHVVECLKEYCGK